MCCLVLFFFFLMLRRPPRSTLTDTLFPYTTRFRSGVSLQTLYRGGVAARPRCDRSSHCGDAGGVDRRGGGRAPGAGLRRQRGDAPANRGLVGLACAARSARRYRAACAASRAQGSLSPFAVAARGAALTNRA